MRVIEYVINGPDLKHEGVSFQSNLDRRIKDGRLQCNVIKGVSSF
jgi:hypothetical protein